MNVVPHYSNQGNQALMELSMTVMTINDATEVSDRDECALCYTNISVIIYTEHELALLISLY